MWKKVNSILRFITCAKLSCVSWLPVGQGFFFLAEILSIPTELELKAMFRHLTVSTLKQTHAEKERQQLLGTLEASRQVPNIPTNTARSVPQTEAPKAIFTEPTPFPMSSELWAGWSSAVGLRGGEPQGTWVLMRRNVGVDTQKLLL